MYTDKQKRKVVDYFDAVMSGEVKDQHIVVTRNLAGDSVAEIIETVAAVRDRNNAAKSLADIYSLVDSSQTINVTTNSRDELHSTLLAAREAVKNARNTEPE
jgi:hypothetical protein